MSGFSPLREGAKVTKLGNKTKDTITDLGPAQTNHLSDLHEIVIDGVHLIVHIVAHSTVLAKLPH